jgi:hypothetical protein
LDLTEENMSALDALETTDQTSLTYGAREDMVV